MSKDGQKKEGLSTEGKIAIGTTTIAGAGAYIAEEQYRAQQRRWEEWDAEQQRQLEEEQRRWEEEESSRQRQEQQRRAQQEQQRRAQQEQQRQQQQEQQRRAQQEKETVKNNKQEVKNTESKPKQNQKPKTQKTNQQRGKSPDKKAAGKRHYEQKKAASQARKKALDSGKSQKGASKAASKATQTKPQNLKQKMQQDKAKANAAKKNAPAKPKQELSWWQKAKNKAKGWWNSAKSTYKTTKSKVSKALDKTWVGRQVKKVVRPLVRTGEKIVKKSVQVAKKSYQAAKKVTTWAAKTRAGRWVAENAPRALKWVKNSKVVKWGVKWGAKLGPKGLKVLSKKIPVAAAVFGVAYAGYEALHGNWGRAGIELASGVLGAFPPYGTAASLAIDAAVIAYDVGVTPTNVYNYLKPAITTQIPTIQLEAEKRKTAQLAAQLEAERQKSAQLAADKAKQEQEAKRQAEAQSARSQMRNSRTAATRAQPQMPQQQGLEQTPQQAPQQGSEQAPQQTPQQQGQPEQTPQQAPQPQTPQQQGLPEQTTKPQTPSGDRNIKEELIQILSEIVRIFNKGDAIVLATRTGKEYTLTQAELEKQMSAKRAQGTMEKLQKAISDNPKAPGLAEAISTYVPELKKQEKGTATVNRNLIDSTVKAIGGSSKVTSITIDGKKIKAKDIQASFGCSKKEAKHLLKAYGRAIEDGANIDNILRDVAQGKRISQTNANDNKQPTPYQFYARKGAEYN